MLAVVGSDESGGLGAGAVAPVVGDRAQELYSSPQRFVDANGVPRRIPKLAVRNRSADDSGSSNDRPGSSMAYTRSENGSSGPASIRSSQHISTSSSTRSLSDDVVTTRRSIANQNGAKNNDSPAKKKKGGMLGFLTLKEPSTSAWAQFAEAEKEKARQRGVTAGAGLPGISSQKLPDFVPKVNSKWDGLPDSAKRKSIDSKRTSRGHRDSIFSTATRQSNWTARTSTSAYSNDPRKAFASPLQSPKSFRDFTAPTSADYERGSSRGSTTQPPALAIGSALRGTPIEESEENRPQTFLLPPSPEGHDKIVLPAPTDLISPLTPPELDADDIRYLQELDARKSQDDVAEVPATPPADLELQPVLVGIHYPELDSRGGESRNASPDFIFHHERKVDVVTPPLPESKRQAINFSRPRSMLPSIPRADGLPSFNIDEIADRVALVERVPLSPTLKDNTGHIEPFLTDTFATHSRETGHIPQRVASTVDPTTRHAGDAADDDSEDEEPEHDTYPDEPDFSTDATREIRHADTTPTVPQARDPGAGPYRSGSQSSLAASIAQSTISEYWYLSPKERLGLGSRVRKSEVLPWDISEGRPESEMSNRASSPLPEGKRKRLSLRLNSKR